MIAVSIAWAEHAARWTAPAAVFVFVASSIAVYRFVTGLGLAEMAEAVAERITR